MTATIDPFTSATELAAAIRRREVSPVEVADGYLDRMNEHDGRLNAFCFRADDEVREAAATATDAVTAAAEPEDLPPFHGVPIPIKDLYDVAGWPTTCGSRGRLRRRGTRAAALRERGEGGDARQCVVVVVDRCVPRRPRDGRQQVRRRGRRREGLRAGTPGCGGPPGLPLVIGR